MHEQDDGLTSSFFSAMMQEYGAALLTIGVGLWFLVRFLRTSGAASPLHSGETSGTSVSGDEGRKKRLEEMQRQYDRQAEQAARKQQEKEAQRRQQQEDELRRMQGGTSDQKLSSPSSRLRANEYNPLMGESGGGSGGYRAQKRKPPGGGCCGSGGGCR